MGNWDEDKRGTLEGAVQITGRHSNDESPIVDCEQITLCPMSIPAAHTNSQTDVGNVFGSNRRADDQLWATGTKTNVALWKELYK